MTKKETKFIPYDHLDKVGEVAVYYGFGPMKSPAVSKADMDLAKEVVSGDMADDEAAAYGGLPFHVEEKIAILRSYRDQNMLTLPQPVALYFKDACRGSVKKNGYYRYADLEILGSSGPIAEAMLIQASRAILSEEGFRNTSVEINSLGDKDSYARFLRELTAYYRKHINEMPPECIQLLKKDSLALLTSDLEVCRELNDKAPKSMDFLSEHSRRHLEEVLEYFEALGIPYTVNNALFGNKAYCMETVFAILENDTETKTKKKVLAMGMRYGGLAKKLGMKRDVQGVGISIVAKGAKPDLRKELSRVKRPIASFIQLGIESKLASLDIVERLRQIKVPLYLSLAKDRLGAQVGIIEKYHTPYVIVMGKKEAVEKTVIVRRTDTHAQEIIPLDDLPKYMKKVESEYWSK